jgi:hypothetical protein
MNCRHHCSYYFPSLWARRVVVGDRLVVCELDLVSSGGEDHRVRPNSSPAPAAHGGTGIALSCERIS